MENTCKQDEEIVFSMKFSKPFLLVIHVNNNPVKSTSVYKHLRMIQDSKLSVEKQLKAILVKVNKTVGLIHKFWLHFPINSFLTINRSFARCHLDYDDVICDKEIESIHVMQQSRG